MHRLLFLLLTAVAAHGADIGPSKGALLVVGGGMRDPAIFERFLELAGGEEARDDRHHESVGQVVGAPPHRGELEQRIKVLERKLEQAEVQS